MPGNPNPSYKLTSETARLAGMKSKRRPRDKIIAEKINAYLEKHIEGTDKDQQDIMIDAAFEEWQKGNAMLMKYLMDRGMGKPKETIDVFEVSAQIEINKEKLKNLTTEELKEYLRLNKKLND